MPPPELVAPDSGWSLKRSVTHQSLRGSCSVAQASQDLLANAVTARVLQTRAVVGDISTAKCWTSAKCMAALDKCWFGTPCRRPTISAANVPGRWRLFLHDATHPSARSCLCTSTGSRTWHRSMLLNFVGLLRLLRMAHKPPTETLHSVGQQPFWQRSASKTGHSFVRLDAQTLSPLSGSLPSACGASENLMSAPASAWDGKRARDHGMATTEVNELGPHTNMKRTLLRAPRRSVSLRETMLTNAEIKRARVSREWPSSGRSIAAESRSSSTKVLVGVSHHCAKRDKKRRGSSKTSQRRPTRRYSHGWLARLQLKFVLELLTLPNRPAAAFALTLIENEQALRKAAKRTRLTMLSITPRCARHGGAGTAASQQLLNLADNRREGGTPQSQCDTTRKLANSLGKWPYAQHCLCHILHFSVTGHSRSNNLLLVS